MISTFHVFHKVRKRFLKLQDQTAVARVREAEVRRHSPMTCPMPFGCRDVRIKPTVSDTRHRDDEHVAGLSCLSVTEVEQNWRFTLEFTDCARHCGEQEWEILKYTIMLYPQVAVSVGLRLLKDLDDGCKEDQSCNRSGREDIGARRSKPFKVRSLEALDIFSGKWAMVLSLFLQWLSIISFTRILFKKTEQG
ncbi:hypothetical protein CPC08DRAFT_727581 [Agrocybe pediades]|nr:hypothetical protein CPC08DRAFT_727581 [Agrocybe pediades]